MSHQNAPLQPLAFHPLPLQQVSPTGWLRNQLRIQADGLSGHLDEFWPDVRDSQWFGGHSEGWERVPYWLDGFIPLAFLLDDQDLIAKATRYMDYILTHQQEDGWLGPRVMKAAANRPEAEHYDLWGQLLVTKVLLQYYDATSDARVPTALAKSLDCIDSHIDRAPLFNWGQFRWFETLIALYWLYERTNEAWLLDLAIKLEAQGFNWRHFFERWPATAPTPKGRWSYMTHVVNNAMMLKAHALWWRVSGREGDRSIVYDMLRQLDQRHGMVTGVFSGDECLAGLRPTQGTELCAVVEYAYSLEVLLSILGDPLLADRLEKIVFNALPATFSPDMWSHQYDQQVNQAQCHINKDHPWTTNGPESNIFGVEPNYGCCTANLSQGWPKFAANLWMRTADGGLAAMAYAPSTANLDIDHVAVQVALDTDYPFRDTLRFAITTSAPVRFPLLLRVPAWAQGATIAIGDQSPQRVLPGQFHRLHQTWQGTTHITLVLPMTARGTRRYNHALSIERGPLVYALPIGESWQRVHEDAPYRELPHADWEVYPTTPWNYALQADEDTLAHDITFTERPITALPFSPQGAPVSAAVLGKQVEAWTLVDGTANDAPVSPVTSSQPIQPLTLIPYGCTNLRIAEFPTLAK